MRSTHGCGDFGDCPRGSDDENLMLVESVPQVDRMNGEFYSRYPYPWSPQTFDFVADPDLQRTLLNQNLGDWTNTAIPPRPRIWVAGCGTNQAVYVALKHPDARIVGSDLSPVSLEICRRTVDELGLSQVELRNETINDATYEGEFDLVISTGVIHHTADPAHALRRLRAALKPTGILELMVYNRFHRSIHSVFQKALRILAGTDDRDCHRARELELARRMAGAVAVNNRIQELLRAFRTAPESAVADALIQPVEHSYTVESLAALAKSCGLELVCPAPNEWDAFAQPSEWHIEFGDADLQHSYDHLGDVSRWQVTNLLLLERSPQLWFYLQRTDANRRRLTVSQINDSFLDTVFEPVRSSRGYYRRQPDGCYRRAQTVVPFPTGTPDPECAPVYAGVDGQRDMGSILAALNVRPDFGRVLACRTRLATSAFPFIAIAGSGVGSSSAEAATSSCHDVGSAVEHPSYGERGR